jgi:hypothetical protein
MEAKIPVKSILIDRAEGPVDLCGPQLVTTYEEASRVFAVIAQTAPDGGGYDKCDFTVTFADGEKYEGRADIQRQHLGGYHLGDHMKQFLGYLAGTYRPAHVVKDSDWKEICDRNAERAPDAVAFLAKYDL